MASPVFRTGFVEDLEDYEHECRKFRICIIGRAGVGKSTLLGKIFGLDDTEARVRHRGQGSGKHDIWTPIWDDRRNTALIIHDSRGFEAGEFDTLQDVKTFINYRSRQATLSDQLHCIWYCISLEDSRAIQQSERDFFEFYGNIRHMGIPLVFVLTKFDKLVHDKLVEVADDDEQPTEWERARARQLAKEFVNAFRTELQNATGNGVIVQEVSAKSRRDTGLVQKLVAQTTTVVKPTLRSVWIRAQGVLAWQKRQACVDLFPKSYLINLQSATSVPILPLGSTALESFYTHTFNFCMTIWNLPGQHVLFTNERIRSAIRDASRSFTRGAELASLLDPLGPITTPLYVRLALKMTCDLIMIFQQLFWATPRRRFLSEADLEDQLRRYKESRVRETIHTYIVGSLGAVNFATSYQASKLKGIIRRTVDAAQDTVAQEMEGVTGTFEEGVIPLPELEA